jgi:hypothetical protein
VAAGGSATAIGDILPATAPVPDHVAAAEAAAERHTVTRVHTLQRHARRHVLNNTYNSRFIPEGSSFATTMTQPNIYTYSAIFITYS